VNMPMGQTDRQMPDSYNTLSARSGQRNNWQRFILTLPRSSFESQGHKSRFTVTDLKSQKWKKIFLAMHELQGKMKARLTKSRPEFETVNK